MRAGQTHTQNPMVVEGARVSNPNKLTASRRLSTGASYIAFQPNCGRNFFDHQSQQKPRENSPRNLNNSKEGK
ncbi:hypothetical protein RJT34_23164 [Clitoria ternatea]|uniref:Uncharacterized protein n=1 Tax=Clitoria ternatea TaxID=43366 RepID=A0AAN9IGY2_CLITE